MSYHLMVFEKSKAPSFYEDFLNWAAEETKWSEDRDYNSIVGTSERLVSWFMEIKEIFPPLNGSFCPSDEEIDTDQNVENHLTDYSIGTNSIYASFGYSAVEEADWIVPQHAKKHDVGFYNLQTGEVHCDGMVYGKLTTESQTEKIAVWEQIEKALLTLDSPKRGSSNRNSAFVTLTFENNGTDQEFMQCIPLYPKQKGLFRKLLGRTQPRDDNKITYTVEAGDGGKLYTKQFETIEEAAAILRKYYLERKLPDLADFIYATASS